MTHHLSGIGWLGKLQIKNVEEHALAGMHSLGLSARLQY
jgi:hypothetical protein